MTPLKRAFLALEAAQQRIAALEEATREPIAIIGLACRVPGGGDDPASFWQLLRDGVDATGPMPKGRWDLDALYHPDPEMPGRIATKRGGFLANVDRFDPTFFGITRREAQGIDPQQRLLLEVAWMALEHAGQPPHRLLRTATGVYFGLAGSDYAYLQLQSGDHGLLDAHFASGIAHSVASGRLSYLLGLQGPSLTIDTACSSSLVATHLACQALRAGECRMAVAGGVNLILSPEIYVALSHSRMLAPDGRCKTFDAAADGFARAEGCGVVVLKRLSDARADGDNILAVILGSAVNQDGPSSGLTAPNGPAQEAVIRDALERSGISPRQVSYIEAHGTGTELGDPLEVAALGAVFGRERDTPLWLGSVKTNLGHLEAAAGVAGLIKVVLSLQQKQIPPHINFSTPSPHIAWDEAPLRVATQLARWEPIEGRRIAGLSSFGFSGTNAHLVVGEAPEANDTAPKVYPVLQPSSPRTAQLFVLSAHNEQALASMAGRYGEAFANLADDVLADVCFSASLRAHHQHRATVLASSMTELCDRLAGLGSGTIKEGVRVTRLAKRDPPRIAFLCTGQGSQYQGMARALDETQPVFRAALDRCAAIFDKVLSRPLRSVIFDLSVRPSVLDETAFTQPALFAIEYAMSQLWRSWGVVPDVVVGHSIGEYVAACLAGVLSLEDAASLVAERGRLMQSLPPGGAMAAIFAPEVVVAVEVAQQAGTVAIGALNEPGQTVISGDASGVDAMCATFTARGVRCQRLSVSHAFHSPRVEPVLDEFEKAARSTRFSPPSQRLISNVTGQLADRREVTEPAYWRRHLREPVRFADCMRTLAGLRPDVCLEVGPNAALLAFASACFEGLEAKPSMVASIRKGRADVDQLNDAVSQLYLSGVQIDWRAVWSVARPRHLELPTYAFERERIWFDVRSPGVARAGRDSGHPLLGVRLRSALQDVAQFEVSLTAESLPYLRDHRVQDRIILPATAFMEMALAASCAIWGNVRELRSLVIADPLVFSEGESRIVQLILTRLNSDDAEFSILSNAPDAVEREWRRHAEGRFASASNPAPRESAQEIEGRCGDIVTAGEHYEQLAARGLVFGPSLQGVRLIRRGHGEAIGNVTPLDGSISGAGDYVIHPALLDACLQVLNSSIAGMPEREAPRRTYLPLAIDSVAVFRTPAGPVSSHARVSAPASRTADVLRGDVVVFDQHGVVARIEGITLCAASDPSGATSDEPIYEVVWERKTDDDSAWVPSPAELASRVAPSLSRLLDEHGADDYQAAFVELEKWGAEWIRRALLELAWRPSVGERFTSEELARKLRVAPGMRRLLRRFLQILEEEGLLGRDDQGWHVQRSPEIPLFEGQAENLLSRHPSSLARIELAAGCGPHIAGVLRGSVDPLQLLFPGGSSELVECLYRDTSEAKAFNQLIREAVNTLASAMPSTSSAQSAGSGGWHRWYDVMDRWEFAGRSHALSLHRYWSIHGHASAGEICRARVHGVPGFRP